MKSDYLKRKKEFLRCMPFATGSRKEFISVVLLGVSALLGVLILIRIAGVFVVSAKAERSVKNAFTRSKPDPNNMEQYFAKSKSIAEKLKKKNLFAPAEPKQHPVKNVLGILGDEALIDGKWYKVGDKVKDAKIVAIEPAQVRVKWQGQEKTFAPIDAVSSSKEEKKGKRAIAKRSGRKRAEAVEKSVEKEVSAGSEEDPLAWMGVKLSATLKAKLLERWNEMSDEQKQQWKEQWNGMSDEQKQKAVDSMEENIDKM